MIPNTKSPSCGSWSTGWWYTYPSEKWWSESESQLGWWNSQLFMESDSKIHGSSHHQRNDEMEFWRNDALDIRIRTFPRSESGDRIVKLANVLANVCHQGHPGADFFMVIPGNISHGYGKSVATGFLARNDSTSENIHRGLFSLSRVCSSKFVNQSNSNFDNDSKFVYPGANMWVTQAESELLGYVCH